MSIPNLTDETPINQYVASSAQTEFAFTFYIFAESDIKVYVNDILKTITTDYVVRKNDGGVIGSADLPMDGGKIVFNVGLTAGAKVSINRDVPIDRSTQFSTGGSFKADVLNSELTRILTVAQQLKRDISRSFRLAPSDAEGGSLQLPTNRANNILAFDGSGNLILIKLADVDKANVSPFIATLLNDTTASQARTTLDAQQLNSNLTFLANLPSAKATTTNQGVAYLNNPITVANNATDANNDIDFSAGNFIFNNGSGQGLLATALTKRLDASWVAGTNQGGLLSGTKAINSTYHYFAIQKPDGTVDVGAILGVAGTTPDPTSVLPSGYTTFSKNPIVSVITDGSGNIINGDFNFKQNGNYIFKFNADINEFFRTNTIVSSLQTITIPAGIKVQAHCGLFVDITALSTGTNSSVTVQDFNQSTVTHYACGVVKVANFTNANYAKPLPVISNKSRQIWFSSTGATNLSSVGLYSLGWETIY